MAIFPKPYADRVAKLRVPFGFLLVKITSGADVRTQGSGNIGATNVLRTTGKGPAVATMVLDIAKGYAAVWIAEWLTGGSVTWMAAAALAVMAGHSFPVFLKFQGGKAVASFVGAFLRLTPAPLLATNGRCYVKKVNTPTPMRSGCIQARDTMCA